MYLKRLEIQGFKSFARRTEFHFNPGITAIVGPNGSGKSNIADAIRWVLGEQSSKLLRTKRSEDVVFAGSSNRNQLGMAEVTLILDNSEQWLPVEFDEVAITRRVYRSGDMEYLINKKRVRLKDIVDLLLRAGVGQGTYTVIGQGLVETALSLRPEERRSLLEEAADVKRHYLKMAETSSRLEATLQNLTRLEDIVAEIQPRLTVLGRQARQAAEYENIMRELSDALVVWHGFSWYKINDNLDRARTNVTAKEGLVAERESHLSEVSQRLMSLRDMQRTERDNLSILLSQRTNVVGQTERLSQTVSAREERILSIEEQKLVTEKEIANLFENVGQEEANLAATIGRLDSVEASLLRLAGDLVQAEKDILESAPEITKIRAELEEAQSESYLRTSRLADANRQLTELRKRIAELERESRTFGEEKAKVEKDIERLEKSRSSLQEELRTLDSQGKTVAETIRANRESTERYTSEEAVLEGRRVELLQERQRLATRLDLLAKLRSSNQGVFGGVRAILELAKTPGSSHSNAKPTEVGLNGIVGIVANILRVPRALEVAIEVALGSRVQDIVVEKWADAEVAIEHLRRHNLGRATFLPLDTIRGSRIVDSPAGEGVIGTASSLVRYDSKFENVVNQLLGNTIVVQDLPTARRLISLRTQASQIVTLAGDVVRTNGAVTGGSTKAVNDTGLLARERELRDLPKEIFTLDQSIAKVIDELELRRTRRQELQLALQAALKEESSLNEGKNSKSSALVEIGHSIDRLTQQITWQDKLNQNTSIEKDSARQRESSLVTQLDAMTSFDAEGKTRVQELRRNLSKAEEKTAEQRELLSQMKTRLAVAERTKASETSLLASYQSSIRRLNQQVEERKQRLIALDEEIARIKQENLRNTEELQSQLQERQKIEDAIHLAESSLSDMEKEELEGANLERDERTQLLALERELAQSHLELQRCQDDLSNLVARMEADGLLEVVLDDSQSAQSRLNDLPRQMSLRLNDGSKLEFPSQESLAQMEINPEALKRKIDRLRGQVRSVGTVNTNAIEEFEETSQRYEFLKTQISDMREAEKTLRDGIASLEDIIKEQFAEAFRLVSEEFSKAFSILFGGGKAELVLTKPEDPTETGLDIIAQPPGKRLQSLSLLSGGERSLTAVALLFALLKVNPSPFCVLDEVDAALDEVNVTRFVDAIAKLSDRTQFIMITHNRASIEASDTLYGITMGADGISRVISVKLDQERREERIGAIMGSSLAG